MAKDFIQELREIRDTIYPYLLDNPDGPVDEAQAEIDAKITIVEANLMSVQDRLTQDEIDISLLQQQIADLEARVTILENQP